MKASNPTPCIRLQPVLRIPTSRPTRWRRAAITTSPSRQPYSSQPTQLDPSALLSRPTWSVRSLLPDSSTSDTSPPSAALITPKQLHHLLRLSALPLPTGPEEEAGMIEVLQSQLSFVRDVQRVDTRGAEPLRSIRDETDQGLGEATIGVEQVREALRAERLVGIMQRPRRPREVQGEGKGKGLRGESWNPVGTAARKSGRFFVVRSSAKSE